MNDTPTIHTSLYFEDFYVGQVLHSGSRVVTATDLAEFTRVSGDAHPLHSDPEFAARTRFGRPILQGPFGLASVFGLLGDMHVIDDSIIGMLDTNWRYLGPIFVGDELSFDMTITGKRRTSHGDQGVVDRHITLHDSIGRIVQEGTSAMLVHARTDGAADEAHRAFGSVQWGERLIEHLSGDTEFASSLGGFEGTIALRSGSDEVGFSIGTGRTVEVAEQTPTGPAFTLIGSKLTWTRLFTGPRNDFGERVSDADITVYGNTLEYDRTTEALTILVDHGRALADEL
ncbi:MaoC family dehydratase [Rhodococcus sp. NPDC057529]|uniref:MaoC family dehydratase n=1 Tax=Rhodococcus sp. NPDC057529 TaxID=3346158 RepID=UPI003670FD49